MKMKFNKEILNLGLTEMKRIQVNSLSKNLVMDKRILWILFLVDIVGIKNMKKKRVKQKNEYLNIRNRKYSLSR